MRMETATIAKDDATKLSNAVDVQGFESIGVLIPPLDSCTVYFKASDKADGTYYRIQKEDWSADLTTGTITTTGVAIILNSLFPFRFLKIEVSATQTTAARTFYIFGKRI